MTQETYDLLLETSPLTDDHKETLWQALQEIAETRPVAHMNLKGKTPQDFDGKPVAFAVALLGDDTPERALGMLGFKESWEDLTNVPLQVLQEQVVATFDQWHGGPPTDLDMQHLEWKRCVQKTRERYASVIRGLNDLHPIIHHTLKAELELLRASQPHVNDLDLDPRYFPVWDTEMFEPNLVEQHAALYGQPHPHTYRKWDLGVLPALQEVQQNLHKHQNQKQAVLDTLMVLKNNSH